ncbi:ornithine carbamoyltransferase [Candidatus Contubernalis alkaliaceticus]|uniref:ornithine carbamoyltransferase n=1 Tax=Candidatus Contubernalis alkaliaceticus TaxID=338645 RepID=UPI001F4C4F45|nr:ornithine carbamoyltransferase [Candidatus Contubernalis alkalaceticus]UNC91493.1 ornithine carbamoyltransferase [Candidatus Contubernalis alkalaceticus]
MSLKGKDLLTLKDWSSEEIFQVLELAEKLKKENKEGTFHPLLKGKTLGMIFQKASTRTRISFEVAMWQLGGYALFLNPQDLQMGRGEPIKDTARVLARYLEGIMIRTFSHSEVEELAHYADIPVVNGLTDTYHPCQALADVLTIREHKGDFKGLKVAYLGDGNNVAHSLILACAKVGINVSAACPTGYEPDEEVVNWALKNRLVPDSEITVTSSPQEALNNADVVYTDVWASMGQEGEHKERLEIFKPFQLNQSLLKQAKSDAIVLHCLPAHREEEITDEVIEGPQSAVMDQAENRLHAQKAVLALVMG